MKAIMYHVAPIQFRFNQWRWHFACGIGCAVFVAMSLGVETVSGQNPETTQKNFSLSRLTEKFSPKKLFQRADPKPAEFQDSSLSYPKSLKVIDRATNTATATNQPNSGVMPQPNAPWQTSSPVASTARNTEARSQVYAEMPADSMRVGRPLLSRVSVQDQHLIPPIVQTASYQQASSRVYATPINDEEAIDNLLSYQRHSPAIEPSQSVVDPLHQIQRRAGYVEKPVPKGSQPTLTTPIQSTVAPSPTIPKVLGQSSEGLVDTTFHDITRPGYDLSPTKASLSPNDSRQPESVYEQFSDSPDGQPAAQNPGRGYLKHGSDLQGHVLTAKPQTATERALELHAENQRLQDAVTRTKHELESRTQELESARQAFTAKEQELVNSLNQITKLKMQLSQQTRELKLAVQEKEAIQRRADETLKAIESNLDGVLMHSISRRK